MFASPSLSLTHWTAASPFCTTSPLVRNSCKTKITIHCLAPWFTSLTKAFHNGSLHEFYCCLSGYFTPRVLDALLSTPSSAYSSSVPVPYAWISLSMTTLDWLSMWFSWAKADKNTKCNQICLEQAGMELMQCKWFPRSRIKKPFVMPFNTSKQISFCTWLVRIRVGWLDCFVTVGLVCSMGKMIVT